MLTNSRKNLGRQRRAAAAPSPRLFVLALCLGLWLAAPALGQAEYSDAYVFDSSEQQYDSSADALYAADDPVPFDLVGVGVTEAPYNGYNYSTSTHTTLYGPGGNAISQSSSGYFYAVAEAISLKLDETTQEGDYEVSTEHRYYQQQCTDPRMDCPMVKAGPGEGHARFERASFSPGAARAAAEPQFFYWVTYTFYRFPVRRMYTAYKFSRLGWPCGGDKPHAWFLWCGQNIPNCTMPVWVCTKYANYWLRGDVYRIYWYYGVTCHVRLYYSQTEPRCS